MWHSAALGTATTVRTAQFAGVRAHALALAPHLAFFFLYNRARFGSLLGSGGAPVTLSDGVESQRRSGLSAQDGVYLAYSL